MLRKIVRQVGFIYKIIRRSFGK